MGKNIIINGTTYTNVSGINLLADDGTEVIFGDTSSAPKMFTGESDGLAIAFSENVPLDTAENALLVYSPSGEQWDANYDGNFAGLISTQLADGAWGGIYYQDSAVMHTNELTVSVSGSYITIDTVPIGIGRYYLIVW